MNIVCLNCEGVIQTSDPRKRFCGGVCRNRWNVRKSRARPRKEKMGIDKLREMIKGIEAGKSLERKVQWQAPPVPKEEWVDPI